MNDTKPHLQDYLNMSVFLAIIGALFVLNLALKPPAILTSERRAPAKLPNLTFQALATGSFMSRFEDYAADSFAFRDDFRGLRAVIVFDILMQSDKSGLYFGDAAAGEFKRLDPAAARQSADKIKKVADTLSDCAVYYSIIPDKSIYAGKYLPGFELEPAEQLLADVMGGIAYIPLADCLVYGSVDRRDLHWDQPKIGAVVDTLTAAMGTQPDLGGYVKKSAGDFKGAYAGQMALPMAPDRLDYLDYPALRASRLNDATLEFEDCPVYDPARVRGIDPYDFFLHGPEALIVLENPDAPEGELYLFRDSYGSSIAPLLTCAYRRVTLIDLRYIDARVLGQFVDFVPGSDVLFLYSSMILNNPSIIRA
jgi:hypothetical protein